MDDSEWRLRWGARLWRRVIKAAPKIKLGASGTGEGRSFEVAFRFLLDNRSWQLVHGLRNASANQAWCELCRDWVYEPVSNRLYQLESFRERFSTEECARYAYNEAISNFLSFESYGPWDSRELNVRPRSVVAMLLKETIRAEQVTDISVARLIRRLTNTGQGF